MDRVCSAVQKPIRYSEEEMLAVTSTSEPDASIAMQDAPAAQAAAPAVRPPADPKTALKAMMDSIPTSREDVFAYQIKWAHYNAAAMGEKFKVRPTRSLSCRPDGQSPK
jgi:hypothetical protein